MDRKELIRDLARVVNCHSIDTELNMSDREIAEKLYDYIIKCVKLSIKRCKDCSSYSVKFPPSVTKPPKLKRCGWCAAKLHFVHGNCSVRPCDLFEDKEIERMRIMSDAILARLRLMSNDGSNR